jgi:hypothetical protein
MAFTRDSNIYIRFLSLSVIQALTSQKDYQSADICKSIIQVLDCISEPMALAVAIKILGNHLSLLTTYEISKVVALDHEGLEYEISSFLYKATKSSIDISGSISLLLKYITSDDIRVAKYAATTLYNLSLLKNNINAIQYGISHVVQAFCKHVQADVQCNGQHIQSEIKLMKSLLTDEAISSSTGTKLMRESSHFSVPLKGDRKRIIILPKRCV